MTETAPNFGEHGAGYPLISSNEILQPGFKAGKGTALRKTRLQAFGRRDAQGFCRGSTVLSFIGAPRPKIA